MVERLTQGKLVWVNMKRPTTEEVRRSMKALGLPPTLMADLTAAVPKNSAVESEGVIKITLDFPVVKRLDIDHTFEVKFLVAKHCLLTVHYEEMEGIDRFRRQYEVSSTLRKKQGHLSGAHLFISLMNSLYESTSSKLDYVESKLSSIEAEIFKNNEKQMVFDISDISKKLIAFRHVVRSHEDVFKEVIPLFEKLYPGHFTHELENLKEQYFILQRRANTQYETLAALRETNAMMLYTKQNEVMKTLTIMAFITFPLTLFSSLFGMNTEATPIIGHSFDFWIIVSIMCLATIGFFTFFKRKDWM